MFRADVSTSRKVRIQDSTTLQEAVYRASRTASYLAFPPAHLAASSQSPFTYISHPESLITYQKTTINNWQTWKPNSIISDFKSVPITVMLNTFIGYWIEVSERAISYLTMPQGKEKNRLEKDGCLDTDASSKISHLMYTLSEISLVTKLIIVCGPHPGTQKLCNYSH